MVGSYKKKIDWVEDEIGEIKRYNYQRLRGEYLYRYVREDDEEFLNEWIINEYSLRKYDEEKFFDEDAELKFKDYFATEFRTYKSLRRNVSISLTKEVRNDFESRFDGPTERVNNLVERMEYLAMRYAIHLEPKEKAVLLGILVTELEITPILIETLAKKVLDSEYYYLGEKEAHTLYKKMKDATYPQLLGTVESLYC